MLVLSWDTTRLDRTKRVPYWPLCGLIGPVLVAGSRVSSEVTRRDHPYHWRDFRGSRYPPSWLVRSSDSSGVAGSNPVSPTVCNVSGHRKLPDLHFAGSGVFSCGFVSGLVVAVGVDDQVAEQFSGGGVDDSDVVVVDEQGDVGSGVGSADADVGEFSGDAGVHACIGRATTLGVLGSRPRGRPRSVSFSMRRTIGSGRPARDCTCRGPAARRRA